MRSFNCFVTTGKLQDIHPEGGHDKTFGEKPQQYQGGTTDALRQRHLQGEGFHSSAPVI